MTKITSVKDNKEKYENYKCQCSDLNSALKSKDYRSTILISYAMIEDRLISFLYYMNIIEKKESPFVPSDYIDKIIRPKLNHKFKDKNGKEISKKSSYKIKNIGAKISIMRIFLNNNNGNSFLDDCYYIISKYIGIDVYKNFIEDLEEWKDYRNEIIHDSFNKNINSLNINLESCAIIGSKLARTASKFTNAIKNKNNEFIIRDKWYKVEINKKSD